MLQFVFDDLQHLLIRLARSLKCWTILPIWVSDILDLQHFHVFIFNPMIPAAKTKLGIKFKHVNMLKIQNILNLSYTFAFILPQQRLVLVFAHAQKFAGKCKFLSPQEIYRDDKGCKWKIFTITTIFGIVCVKVA